MVDGVALAAIAAAYFLTGERGKKNRKAIKEWAVKANEEVSAAVKKAGTVTKAEYNKIAKEISSRYKHLTKTEFAHLSRMLRSHWDQLAKEK